MSEKKVKGDQKIKVSVYWTEDEETGKRVYDVEEMERDFEFKLKQLQETDKTEDDEYYDITALNKDDIIACYEGTDEIEDVKKAVAELTPSQMRYIARKMADSFCDCCYWDALKYRFESTKYDDWKKDKEEKEYDKQHGTE